MDVDLSRARRYGSIPGVRVLYASGAEERRSAVCAADVPLCEFCEADWCEHECHGEVDSE